MIWLQCARGPMGLAIRKCAWLLYSSIYDPEILVFLDEISCDKRDAVIYLYVRSER